MLTIFLFIFFALEVSGQEFSREYWKQVADDSKAIIVGIVEEQYRVIRPEKFKLNPDGSSPTTDEIYLGTVFRVKVTEKLKGKLKTEKIGEYKYVNIFLRGAYPTLGITEPHIFKGGEFVLFLELGNDEELKVKEKIEFREKGETVSIPFDHKTSYVVVQGSRGAVEIKKDREMLIEEIKKAID